MGLRFEKIRQYSDLTSAKCFPFPSMFQRTRCQPRPPLRPRCPHSWPRQRPRPTELTGTGQSHHRRRPTDWPTRPLRRPRHHPLTAAAAAEATATSSPYHRASATRGWSASCQPGGREAPRLETPPVTPKFPPLGKTTRRLQVLGHLPGSTSTDAFFYQVKKFGTMA